MKKIIKRIVISFLVVAAVMVILCSVLLNVYGNVSIPSICRPRHKAMETVENVHNDFAFTELAESSLPRIDIMMAEDYLLSKESYTECSVQISKAGEYDIQETSAKIRIRGNTTAYADKKPFKIKFDEKISLFGGGNEKSWVLLANAIDMTGIHNYVAMQLYDYLSEDGTFIPMCIFVDVYINGEFQGVYNLCDQIETGDKRVPIRGKIKSTPKNTDYLIVQDHRAYYDNSDCGEEGIGWFWMDKLNISFAVKSPEVDEDGYSSEYTQYIKERIDFIYNIIAEGDYDKVQEYVDTDSIINGFLVSIIAKNIDMGKSSNYFYLPAGGKLTYGPVWDMDLTFGYGISSEPVDTITDFIYKNAILEKLLDIPEFREEFTERFNEIYEEVDDFLYATIDDIVLTYHEELENDFTYRKDWMRYGTKKLKKPMIMMVRLNT